jgi:ornithine decarboxylase
VKCNNLEPILSTLKEAGTGFDCASSNEFEKVKGTEIIYANPCKSREELGRANQAGIQLCTFDSGYELNKVYTELPFAKPVLRIHVDDKGGSRVPLNKKFGFSINSVKSLLDSKPIYGLAFHVGSDCTSLASYQSAFDTVREFVDAFKHHPRFFPRVLDIGGGFSGNSANDCFFVNRLAPLIRQEVSTLPFERVIAEPGRFFGEESCSLHVPIIGRKTLPDGTECITVDESVYGIFSGVLFDGFKPVFTSEKQGELQTYTVFGRTCDSADCIAVDVRLPSSLEEGDILEVKSIGAYSYVSASEFNGFPRPSYQVCL